MEDTEAWFRAADFDGQGRLTRQEVVDALKASVDVNEDALEEIINDHWDTWDARGEGLVDKGEVQALAAFAAAHLPRGGALADSGGSPPRRRMKGLRVPTAAPPAPPTPLPLAVVEARHGSGSKNNTSSHRMLWGGGEPGRGRGGGRGRGRGGRGAGGPALGCAILHYSTGFHSIPIGFLYVSYTIPTE